MANKVERILESVKNTEGEKAYAEIIATCGKLDEKPTPAQQAKYIVPLMREITERFDAETVRAIMIPCGGSCLSDGVVKTAKMLYAQAQNIDDFLGKLNARGIGGGRLLREGGAITGGYDRCYCGLAKAAKGISPAYCLCSAGWFERLFSQALGCEVTVSIIETIVGGAARCQFAIVPSETPNMSPSVVSADG